MYRVVIDTNLIISGTATTNTIPYHLLEKWRKGEFILVTSPQIIEEVKEVFERPAIRKYFCLEDKDIKEVVEMLTTRSFMTAGILEVDAVKNDPDDNMLIACAIEGSATFIVTGDKDLLSIKEYQGIKIVKARDFLEKYLRK